MTKKWHNFLIIGILALSLVFILWLTILSRIGCYTRQFYPPLSSYKAVINGSGYAFLEIIGNIILFVPIGVMFSVFFRLDLKRSLGFGFALSLVIECCQWFFWLGTFEVDDLFHNSLGAVLGTVLVTRTVLGKILNISNRKKSLILLLSVVVLFTSSYLGYHGLKLNEMRRIAALNDLDDGRKNLLVLNTEYEYIGKSNINITNNYDGSIFIEGSSENRAWIHIGTMILKPGKYVLTGLSDLDEFSIAIVLDAYDEEDGRFYRICQEIGSVKETVFTIEEEKKIRALISIYPGDSYSVTARPAVYQL